MAQSKDFKKDLKGDGALQVCPYLGVEDDPATHFAWAKPGHFCYHVKPPQAVVPSHQEAHCLSKRYFMCMVYSDTWYGPLPPDIRDYTELDLGTRAALLRSTIGGKTARSEVPTEPIPIPKVDPVPMVGAARNQFDYMEEQEPSWMERNRKRLLMAISMLVPLLVIVIGVGYVVLSQRDSDQVGSSLPPTLDLVAVGQTWTAEAIVALAPTPVPPTQTATSLPPTPTYTPVPPTATELPATLTSPPPTETMMPAANCQDIQSYSFNILSGPELTPEPGFTYVVGSAPPNLRASWLIENVGACAWNDLFLLSTVSNRKFIPYVRSGDNLIPPENLPATNLLPTGEQISILLGFDASTARNFTGEWVLIVNGLSLENQPHLMLEVINWVIRVQPTPTERIPVKPPSSGPTNTPAPQQRPTDTPPSSRP